jgi:two-component sensor histidine kinase
LALRLATAAAAVTVTCLFQLPIERELPGEPFLLFLLVVIASTFAFGVSAGFVSVGLSTVLSALFFEPVGSFSVQHATNLIKIELYALLAGCCVIAFACLRNMLSAASQRADDLKRLNERKSVLLRELAHGVANNFANIAAFISVRSTTIRDAQSRAILDEAIEQIRIIGQVHARLRAGDRGMSLGSRDFLENLCEELKASLARDRLVSIECEADDLPLSKDQAVSLGLVVNELVTNAIKHAFPGGRRGCIRVDFEVFEERQLQLCVQDDGIGFADRAQRHGRLGQKLVHALSRELGGDLEIKSSATGSSFRLRIPRISKVPADGSHPSTVIH